MPHTGSTPATAGRATATSIAGRGPRGRVATISARIERATSAGVQAPMSSPAGVRTRSPRASGSSRESTTAWPRRALATSPT